MAARFRELELELGSGTPDLLDTVDVLLARAGAVPGGYASKVSRALGPLASAPPDLVEADPPRPRDPAGDVVRAHLTKNVLALLEMDRQVRLDEPDSVHQMRVAARRIRSGLKTFGPLVDEQWATNIREEVAWIAGVLGAVRDREVLRVRLLSDLDRVGRASPDIEVAAAGRVIDRALTDEAAAARAGVLEVLRSPRYVELLETLHQAALSPQFTAAADEPAARSLPPLVGRAWRRLDHAVAALTPDSDEHLWHEARIKAKQARYAAEAVAPVFGKPAKRFAGKVELVTELLGEHQDAAVAAHTVSTMASGRRTPGPVGFALGLLHSFEQDTMAGQRKEFRKIWHDVSRPRWRRLAASHEQSLTNRFAQPAPCSGGRPSTILHRSRSPWCIAVGTTTGACPRASWRRVRRGPPPPPGRPGRRPGTGSRSGRHCPPRSTSSTVGPRSCATGPADPSAESRAAPRDGEPIEVDVLDWLPADEAKARLSYHHDTEVVDAFVRFVEALDRSAEPTAVEDADLLVLLRHAKAVKRATWTGSDTERPLDLAG